MKDIKKIIMEAGKIFSNAQGIEAGIIDSDGIILACTQTAREGDEDSAVRAIILSDDIKIHTSGKKVYKKFVVRDGDEYIGFLEDKYSENQSNSKIYLELFVNWVQSALKAKDSDMEHEAFLKKVLLENELPGDIPLKAREYKIPYAATRVVFTIKVNQSESQESLQILQSMFPDRKAEYVFPMDEETIVLLKEIPREEPRKIYDTAKAIQDTLDSESMSRVRIGIGMYADTLRDAAKSYRESSLALTIGNIFESDNSVMRYDKLGLGRLIYQLPTTLCNMFLDEVFPKGAYEALDSETLLTIQKFFENNLNGSETSRQLFVHRNTLVYRLDKVQKITGLDLRVFDDAVLFKLASMVRRYLEKQDRDAIKTGSGKWWNN